MKTTLETPAEIRQQIWVELGRATQDRHHAWRTPVLATADLAGGVSARTVVLRAVDANAHTLQIYTDARSPKVATLLANPAAAFVFWSPRLNWQLKAKVSVSVETAGPRVERLWEKVRQSASACDYLSATAPGMPLAADGDSAESTPDEVHHFGLLIAQVTELDWLELSRSGHRRAKITGDAWEWLVP